MSGNNDIDIHLRGHAEGLKPAATEAKDTIRDLKDDVVSKTSEMTGASRGLVEMLAKLPLPLVAAGAAAAGLAKAYADGAEEMKKMNLAIALGGNISGQTAGSLRALAEETASYSQLTIAESKEMASVLAGSGQIGAAAFRNITLMAGDFARVMGTDVKAVGPELVKLFDDPAKGAEELNRRMHFLSVTQLDHIAHLQRMGEVTQAQTEFSRLLGARLEEIAPKLGIVERAWAGVGKVASAAWDKMMGIGREASPVDQLKGKLDAVNALIKDAENSPLMRGALPGLMQRALKLQDELDAEQQKGADKSAKAEQNRREQAARELINANSVTARAKVIDDEIALIRKAGGASKEADEAIAKLQSQRSKLFESKSGSVARAPKDKSESWDDMITRQTAELLQKPKIAAAEYAAKLATLDEMFFSNEISAEDYTRAVESLARMHSHAGKETRSLKKDVEELSTTWEGGATRALRAYLDELGNVSKQSERFMGGMLREAEETFVNIARTGKFNMSSLGEFIRAEMARSVYKQNYAPAVASGTSWLTSAIGNLFSGGGGYPIAPAGISEVTFGGFASGGDHRGGYRIVGENGPELEATGPSRIFNNSQTRDILSGGGVQVIVNDQRSASSAVPVGVEQSRNGDGMQQIRILIRDEVRGLVGNGQLDASMRASYGVQRSLTKRS